MNIELACLHEHLTALPIHTVQQYLDSGLLFPQLPLIDGNSLKGPLLVAKTERRIIIINHHPDSFNITLGPGAWGCYSKQAAAHEQPQAEQKDRDFFGT